MNRRALARTVLSIVIAATAVVADAEASDPAPVRPPAALNAPRLPGPASGPVAPGIAYKERAPGKATISLNCEKVITLSTGSGRGNCRINPADGSGRCDDGDGNAASATCRSCQRTTGAGSCLIR